MITIAKAYSQEKPDDAKLPIFSSSDFPATVWLSHTREDAPDIPHYHPELEFHLILQGSGSYFIGGDIYPFKKDSLLLIRGDQVHNFIPLRQSAPSVKKMTLCTSPRMLRQNQLMAGIMMQLSSCCHIALRERAAMALKLLLEEIHEECEERNRHWRETVSIDLQKFLFILDRAKANQISPEAYVNPLLKKVVLYMEDHFAEKILLEDMAQLFGIPRCSLSRAFRKHTGVGFKSYIIHRRIVEAKRLLEETELKVSSVAAEVGFDDLSTFNRDFRLLVGVSPSDYRKISASMDSNSLEIPSFQR